MSGGFFRGTSADQDTRFSNKQAKLLKSKKFPSELEQLVDITKVKMEVMKPWIAQRVTEFLGFEDEVLINFIYGLLDGKQVNGKEVQISLTGFMEKNTGKFMKELWQLLLSAQNNASGVPQQLLDAKEEETRKKQAESDMIKSEMQKKKDKEDREIEEEKMKKLDGELGMERADNASLEPSSKRFTEASDKNEITSRNGARSRSRLSKSPHSSSSVSLSPRERRKSRGLSRSPLSRRRSISSERVHHYRPRRSISPHRKYSPPIRRSPHSRRRSTSRSCRSSPSPIRRRMRSPLRYRSRSPNRRRSQTPVRRISKSPPSYRSKSPIRRRYPSPLRRRSPSPVRRRYSRSPLPRSPSPIRRRSPFRNRRRSPTPTRYRSRLREALSSLSPVRRLSPSPVRKRSPKCQRPPVRSPRENTRAFQKSSPARHVSPRGSVENSDEIRVGPGSKVQQPYVSLRSLQRDTRVLKNTRRKPDSSSSSPERAKIHSKSPQNSRRRSPNEDKSPYKSPMMQPKEHKEREFRACPQNPRDKKPRTDSPESDTKNGDFDRFSPYRSPMMQPKERKEREIKASPQNPRDKKPRTDSPESDTKNGYFDRSRDYENQKLKPSERSDTSSKPATRKDLERDDGKHHNSLERSVCLRLTETMNRSGGLELRKKELESRSEQTSSKMLHPDDSVNGKVPAIYKKSQKAGEKIRPIEVDEKDESGSLSSGSDDSYKHRNRKVHESRKPRRSRRKEVTSYESSDSDIEDRREAKRRKKEEKRSKKEERHRRREERHRRREERCAKKLKAKSNYGSDAEETVSEQKKLEIELREKALESIRAKKGGVH